VSSKGSDASRQPFMVAFFQSSGHRTTRSRTTRETQRRTKKKLDTTPAESSYSPHPFTGGTGVISILSDEHVIQHWTSQWWYVSDSSVHWSSRSCQIQTLYVSFRDLEWHVSSVFSTRQVGTFLHLIICSYCLFIAGLDHCTKWVWCLLLQWGM
jgi:hypothetical protein